MMKVLGKPHIYREHDRWNLWVDVASIDPYQTWNNLACVFVRRLNQVRFFGGVRRG